MDAEEFKFPKNDMKKAALDIYELPLDVDIYKAFPVLSKIPGWSFNFKNIDKSDSIGFRNKFIRYVVYFYSPRLKCIQEKYPSHRHRKVVCALMAGFEADVETGAFITTVENLLEGKTSSLNHLILMFLKHYGNDSWATIKFLRDQYYLSMAQATNVLDSLELKRLMESEEKISQFEDKLLSGDVSERMTTQLIQTMEAEGVGLSPEDIALNIQEGKTPLGFNYYE